MKPSNYYRANEDLRFKLTTIEEERELFTKAKAGDDEARTFLIRNHLLFAATYARRQNRGKLPDDEVVSAVNAALMNAIGRFDPLRGNRFTRYLVPFLRGALASLWKEKNTVESNSQTGEFPTFTPYEEEADQLDGRPGGRAVRQPRQIVDMVPATDDVVAEAEDLSLNLAMLSNCKAKLTDSEKELLRLIYEDGISMADIARERKVSRQAVHAAHGQIVEKLRGAFKKGSR
jgi:RNA polymerase sigma factor (sigma-70 family)